MASRNAGLAVAAAAAAAVLLGYAATRAAGPVPAADRPGPLTEIEGPAQNFAAHLASAAELLVAPVLTPHKYPPRTCPGTNMTIHNGWAPLYRVPDPEVASAPAEAAW